MKHLNCKINKKFTNKVHALIKVSLIQLFFSRKPGREATLHLIKLTSKTMPWNESKKFQEADIWCHFGAAIIREPDEGEK